MVNNLGNPCQSHFMVNFVIPGCTSRSRGKGSKCVKRKKPPKSNAQRGFLFEEGNRRRPTLPHSYPCSTIGAEELNFRVRNGNGWILFAMTADKAVW